MLGYGQNAMAPNILTTNQTFGLALTLPAPQKQMETRAELKACSDAYSGTSVPVALPLEHQA